MTTTSTPVTTTTIALDRAAYDDFVHYLATGEDPHRRISPDVVAEMTFPHVTFELEGKAAFDHGRDQVSDHPWELDLGAVYPTETGFVAVIGATARTRDGGSMRTHTITVVTLREGRVAEVRHWCSGAL